MREKVLRKDKLTVAGFMNQNVTKWVSLMDFFKNKKLYGNETTPRVHAGFLINNKGFALSSNDVTRGVAGFISFCQNHSEIHLTPSGIRQSVGSIAQDYIENHSPNEETRERSEIAFCRFFNSRPGNLHTF